MTKTETTLFEEITTLLASPRAGAGAPAQRVLEDALTSGYAHVLELEAERLRVARRLGAVPVEAAGERDALADRLRRATGELAELRDLLEPLKRRVSELRFAASA